MNRLLRIHKKRERQSITKKRCSDEEDIYDIDARYMVEVGGIS